MQPTIMKSTMNNGLILGILFTLNFLLSISKTIPFILLSYALMAFILVYTYQSAKRYRDRVCEGFINYGNVFSFILLSYFFAGLISAIFKYIYFQYIQPEYLAKLLNESYKALDMLNVQIDDATYKQMESMLKPANFSLQIIWLNVFLGTVIGLIMSFFLKKQKSIFEE